MTEDDPLVRALRDASSPGLRPGAAERIVEAAYVRVAAGRRPVRRLVAIRRATIAAAAAIVVAVTVLALRGTAPAFAVEGDPVMVERRGAWVETRSVYSECLVRVPNGVRVLRSAEGSLLTPTPGSVFRVRTQPGTHASYRVEFSAGGGDVQGSDFVVSMPGEVLVERDPASPSFRLSVSLDGGDGSPRIAVLRGSAVVHRTSSSETMRLAPAETAAYMPVRVGHAMQRRLTRIESWSPAAEAKICGGVLDLVDASVGPRGGLTLFGSSGNRTFFAYEVAGDAVSDVIGRVNEIGRLRAGLFEGGTTACAGAPSTRYVYEKDDVRVEVLVSADGSVRVADRAGARFFSDLAHLHVAEPATTDLFLETLR